MSYQTVSEYAVRQGCCLSTVYQRLRIHKIPGAVKLDGIWRIPLRADVNPEAKVPKHLLQKLESQKQSPQSEASENTDSAQLEHARMLSRELGWLVLKSNTNLLAEAILAESKSQGVTEAKAYEALREGVLADRADGVSINGAYFREAKWRRVKPDERPKRPVLSPDETSSQLATLTSARGGTDGSRK
jgi:hypothetical protein